MSSSVNSYHEEQLKYLSARRQLIEKKIDLRQSTLAEFAAVHEESTRRQRDILSQQCNQVRQRNSQLLQDLRRCAMPHRFESTHAPDPLSIAKSTYLDYVDRTMPMWKRHVAHQKLQTLQMLEKEKEIATRRRLQQQQLAQEEAALHDALTKRQQELAYTIALEKLETRQANDRMHQVKAQTEQQYYTTLQQHLQTSTAAHEEHLAQTQRSLAEAASMYDNASRQYAEDLAGKALSIPREALFGKDGDENACLRTPLSPKHSFVRETAPIATPTPVISTTKSSIAMPSYRKKTPERKVSIDPSIATSPRKQESACSINSDISDAAPPESVSSPQIIHQGSVSSIDVTRTHSADSSLYIEPVIDLKRSPRKASAILSPVTHDVEEAEHAEEQQSFDIVNFLDSVPTQNCARIISNLTTYFTLQTKPLNLTSVLDGALRHVMTGAKNPPALRSLLCEAQDVAPAGMSPAIVGIAILRVIDVKASELMPSDVMNGVLTDQKLIKHYRKVGGGKYDLWMELLNFMRNVMDAKLIDAAGITRIVSAALCLHMSETEKERAERKITKVLMLCILPESESPQKQQQKKQQMTSFALPADPPRHEVSVEEPKHQQNYSMTSRLLAGSKLADLELDDFEDIDEIESPPKPIDISVSPYDETDEFDF